jgi:NAD(P)-dependent dehydrogenase (short-subunit alcohol dehydrogenase family)
MASVAGLVGTPGATDYAASKHGVVGLTRSVALEYARQNIRVNAVCPGYSDTPMVAALLEASPDMARQVNRASPMHRMGTPDEIAEAVVWLCSDKASFVNGQALALDGGLTAS